MKGFEFDKKAKKPWRIKLPDRRYGIRLTKTQMTFLVLSVRRNDDRRRRKP